MLTNSNSTAVWSLAWGSCHHQGLPSPTLITAAAVQPDVFVWLGDNLYNDMDAEGKFCEPSDCDRWWWQFRRPLRVLRRRLGWSGFPRAQEHNRRTSRGEMNGLRRKYKLLSDKREFLTIRQAAGTMVATWDGTMRGISNPVHLSPQGEPRADVCVYHTQITITDGTTQARLIVGRTPLASNS